ncbi:hypothetical protein PMG11_09290 [Penicillium brasilianum]|uniref:Uncharacterized protein n=1 Tax=Penicillium brasilianum TaxID=104259 RepID=A0A0F7U0C3_PENBI|nr:hypothetical protein PMG11_09290 [Penicillium brasilianum]
MATETPEPTQNEDPPRTPEEEFDFETQDRPDRGLVQLKTYRPAEKTFIKIGDVTTIPEGLAGNEFFVSREILLLSII